MGLHKVYLGGLNILSLGYVHMYALLELRIRLSILWLLNTALHCYPGDGQSHTEVATNSA
eukprot:268003-Pelagomonas_calceolata.AAC.1